MKGLIYAAGAALAAVMVVVALAFVVGGCTNFWQPVCGPGNAEYPKCPEPIPGPEPWATDRSGAARDAGPDTR